MSGETITTTIVLTDVERDAAVALGQHIRNGRTTMSAECSFGVRYAERDVADGHVEEWLVLASRAARVMSSGWPASTDADALARNTSLWRIIAVACDLATVYNPIRDNIAMGGTR